MTDQELAAAWLEAKRTEKDAEEYRRSLEDKMLSLFGIPEAMDGTETLEAGRFEVKITGRMNRKVDADMAREIAIERGIEAHMPRLFRWKAEINAGAWKATDESITAPLLAAITTTPGRPGFAIKEK